MTPNEVYYLKVRDKLDDLGYLQPLSFESALLVDKVLEDLLITRKNLQHFKNVAQQSLEACSELQTGVGPYKEDNTKLLRENNELHQKLLKAREEIEETKIELRRKIRNLEKERTLQDYLCTQHASKISQLQTELAQKTARLMEFKSGKSKLLIPGHNKKVDSSKTSKDHLLETAQEQVNHLTQEITKLKCEQQELDEVIESLKNKVNVRDTEIERLTNLLVGGRLSMAPGGNLCPCCSPQILDCRLLAKNKELSEQLEDSKQKQHEAMVRAVELAERNQALKHQQLCSARSDTSKSSKLCCCAENSKKITSLQAKLEERILQVDCLEKELTNLKKSHNEIMSEKLSAEKILEMTLEEKKKINDRINELTIIEHHLMQEIESLKQTNAIQKSQLAQLEEEKTATLKRVGQQTEIRRQPFERKTLNAPQKLNEARKCTGYPNKETVRPKPVSQPAKVTKPFTKRPPEKRTNIESSGKDWQDLLKKERETCEKRLQEMTKEYAEHCAKFHPHSSPQSDGGTAPASDPQWLLLERVQAERDYYYKEFSRFRDQLSNIRNHSTEVPSGATSPHQKLELLLSERDFYQKEMCRLLDILEKSRSDVNHGAVAVGDRLCTSRRVSASRSDCPLQNNEMVEKISAKEEDIKLLSEKIAELECKLSSGFSHTSEDMERRINLKEEEILNLRERLKIAEKANFSQVGELQQKLNLKEEDILGLREKIRNENEELWRKLNLKEDELLRMQEKMRQFEQDLSDREDMKRRLNLKEEEILNLRERSKITERNSSSQERCVSDLLQKLNLKEEEILCLREKIRGEERNHVPVDFAQRNEELWRKLNLKEDELLKMQEKLRRLEQDSSDILQLKQKFNAKEEEILCLKEQIRQLESNRCNSSTLSQAATRRLELDLEAARSDCTRLRDENKVLRNDMQCLKEKQWSCQTQLEQAKLDFDRCVQQFGVERQSFTSQIKQLNEDLQFSQEKSKELQREISEHRSRSSQLKMVNEQTERELRTTQELLHRTDSQLASALDRVQEISDQAQTLEWQLKEARQESSCLRTNIMHLDQEKDALILKVDDKTEKIVRIENELESRDHRIASLESFIADLQKKLDVALDTAARSEQSTRQVTQEHERLRNDLDKAERVRITALKENRRLQDDLAAVTVDHQQLKRSLESSKREVEDLKLQLQGYVAEVRRITDILEQKEAERMAILDQYRSLSAESAHLESNNHTLESEAKSTRTRLCEAQTRLQDLEASLAERKVLVHGYEKQIKDLTYQVAKMERKLEARAKSDEANKGLSRELEAQKHFLENQVDKLTCVNQQLEEGVGEMRGELDQLEEQLGKERKNSATLGDMLESTRQETLLRAKDNSELKGQVMCLQGKLIELQDKLKHGSDALRHCQTECDDYQTQVEDLKKELCDERTHRARLEGNLRVCTCPLKSLCPCCLVACRSPASLTLPSSSSDNVQPGTGRKEIARCARLRIPLPPVPPSASFPTESREFDTE